MLNNVTTGSALTAQSHNAEATSEKVTQLIVNEDYRKVKDMRAWFNLPSLFHTTLTGQKDIDTFITARPLVEGDSIIINNGGVYADLVLTAGMITPVTNAFLIPKTITSATTYGQITSSYDEPDLWMVLNPGYSGTAVYFGNATNVNIIYSFPEATKVNSIYVNFEQSEAYNFYGSNNGVDYTLLGSGSYISGTLNIATPAAYTHYKMIVTSTLYRMRQLLFYGDGVSINTSSITAGATPTSAHILPTMQINEIVLTEDITTRFMTGATIANAAIRYNDIVIIPTRTVETNIKFHTFNNQLTEFTKYLYEIDLDRGNELHTSNIAPANTVSVEGANAPLSTDAYLAFDGDLGTPALTIATDATGVVDISHIYMFDTPTTIYKLQTDYGLAIEAPMEYTVSGSFDGVSYTQLLSVSQDVAIDDLSLTKSFDINLYDAYKYYKIHITLGNPNSNVSFKQYTLLKESDVDVF